MAWTAVTGVLAVLMLSGCGPTRPVQNIDPTRHPNLAAAQNLVAEAFDKVSAAQHANEWDMQGHASRAKDLMVTINEELKQAALTANHH
jgi:hypothetical protein